MKKKTEVLFYVKEWLIDHHQEGRKEAARELQTIRRHRPDADLN